MRFDKDMVDKARQIYHTVYVDQETPEAYIGSTSGYDGDRIRIYRTGWDYESEIIIRNNDELAEIIAEDMNDWLLD